MATLDTEVLIVGAGPTGLALALWLTRQGRARADRGPRDRARGAVAGAGGAGTHPRALPPAGSDRRGIAPGVPRAGVEPLGRGPAQAHLPFAQINAALSPYGPLMLPQDHHERAARRTSADAGHPRRALGGTAGLRPTGRWNRGAAAPAGGPRATVRCALSRRLRRSELARARQARHRLPRRHLPAALLCRGYSRQRRGHGRGAARDLDEADFLAVFPIGGPGRARLVGTLRDAPRAEQLQFSDVSRRAIEQLKIAISRSTGSRPIASTTASRRNSARTGPSCSAMPAISTVRPAARA